jgi:lysophospholipase
VAAFDDPAPLSAPDEMAIPPGGRAFWFEGARGFRLRAALFPAPQPRGSVVLSAGRTEYIEKYLETIAEWVGRGFTVLAHDWRGQGLSQRLAADRLKGCADGFDDFIADFGRLMDAYGADLPGPRIAFGHSMGGALTVAALARKAFEIAGAIVTAPMFGVLVARNPAARPMVWLMSRAGQGHAFVERPPPDPFAIPFEGNILTRDAPRFARIQRHLAAHPDLALGGVTWGWVDSAFALTTSLARDPAVARLALPVTVLEAGEEGLVDNAAVQAVTARLPAARLVRIPDARHEILMETDAVRAIFWRAFDDLAAQVGA